MAHFAKIVGDRVEEVIVISNEVCGDLPFPESEPLGQTFIAFIGIAGYWLQTSYNDNFRKQYAGIGYTYDEAKDQFVAPKPYPSWVLNTDNDWVAPVSKPRGYFTWNESTLSWDANIVG
jgi:hypothetical protein